MCSDVVVVVISWQLNHFLNHTGGKMRAISTNPVFVNNIDDAFQAHLWLLCSINRCTKFAGQSPSLKSYNIL